LCDRCPVTIEPRVACDPVGKTVKASLQLVDSSSLFQAQTPRVPGIRILDMSFDGSPEDRQSLVNPAAAHQGKTQRNGRMQVLRVIAHDWLESRDDCLIDQRLGILAQQFQQELRAIAGIGLDGVECQA
jgi:hypothetical protein